MPDRLPRVKWPRTFPVCALCGIVLALVSTGIVAVAQIRLMQPLQRFYVEPFLRASAVPLRMSVKLIEVHVPGRGYIMAVDPWIAIYEGGNRLKIQLTGTALSAGITGPRMYVAEYINPRTIRPFFEHSIFHGSVSQTFRVTIIAFCAFFAGGLLTGVWFDQQHQEAARRGIQIRGPRLMPPRKAHRYLKGDGIALFLQPKAK